MDRRRLAHTATHSLCWCARWFDRCIHVRREKVRLTLRKSAPYKAPLFPV